MSRGPVQVGLIGCGYISEIYLKNAARFADFDVVACADVMPERAQARADQFGIPRSLTVSELLADSEIEVVLNLTTPNAHAAIAQPALENGKGVYNEKPLAISLADGARLADTARESGLRLGSAPDTFLGAGLQTCLRVIDEGLIGEPVAATAFMLNHGPERWHPAPDFYYQEGAGPLFDMAPYYLTALVALLGPISRVTGSARASQQERLIESQPRAGERIAVEVPTHYAAVLDFASGPIGTLVTSFDVWGSEVPRVEVYGTEGSLSVPDPNTFGGPVRVRRAREDEWHEIPIDLPFADNSRGLGLADLAHCLRTGTPHRASGELAYHILEVMHAVERASIEERHMAIESAPLRPEPFVGVLGDRGIG
jgi:predicted dehydrogenase